MSHHSPQQSPTSRRNQDATGGDRTARERLRQRREREKAAERRNRTLKAAGAVVAVLAVIGTVAVLLGRHSDAPPAARPVALGKDRAPSTLTVYEDFRCPACAHFERTYGETVNRLRERGLLRTEYHLVTLIDGNLGGKGSRYAANAALCARDADRFVEYHDVLFAHQPRENEDAFGDTERLIELAGEVDGLDTPAFRRCVRGGAHEEAVRRSHAAFLTADFQGTPTVLLDGEDVYGGRQQPLTPEELERRVERAADRG